MFAALAWRPTEAQRMLASLAHTRAQLRAALFGLADEQLDQQPAPGEWSVREALSREWMVIVIRDERDMVIPCAACEVRKLFVHSDVRSD